MYKGHRVISVTPYGRRHYVALLCHYLERTRGLIDEHHFWVNTLNHDDLRWLDTCIQLAPDFYRAIRLDEPFPEFWPFRIHKFFGQYGPARDTIFVRFDDDIVWIEHSAVERLLDFRIANPQYFLVYANTVNNSLCSYLHQRMGLIGGSPPLEYDCLGELSWKSWQTAAPAHRALLSAIRASTCERFFFDRWELLTHERCSINCMSRLGHDQEALLAGLQRDEENSLACTIPKLLGRINCVTGNSLVSHFAYFPQRQVLEANTKWHERYRELVQSNL